MTNITNTTNIAIPAAGFAVYQEGTVIYGVGATRAAAIEDANGNLESHQQVSEYNLVHGPRAAGSQMAIAPCTQLLIDLVREHGGDRSWDDHADGVMDADGAVDRRRRGQTPALDRVGNLVDLDEAATLMDSDLREELHSDHCDLSSSKFLALYAERHAAKFDGEEFAPYHGGAS